MLYIRNVGNAKALLSESEQLAFTKACEQYTRDLKATGQLIAAQPLLREGTLLFKNEKRWAHAAIDPGKDIQVGYYHIRAEDMAQALLIAKKNPEFEFIPSASIEVRPVQL